MPAEVALVDPVPSGRVEAPMYDLIELLFFAYRDFVGDADRLLESYGFGRAHHRVLYFVNRRPGLTIAELLEILRITKQSLNRVLRELVDKVCSGRATQADLDEIRGTAEVTRNLSHCGLGQTAANPLIDTLLRFPASYTRKLVAGDGNPGFDLDAELADARKLSGRDDLAAHGLETHHD